MGKSQARALRALQRAAFFAGIATAAHHGAAEGTRLGLQACAHEGDDARLLAGGQAREVELDLPAAA